jgi:putative hydrolase of the HAD superfamily
MSAFRNVDTWVFDLDNTLYPASCRLFDQMHVRMGEYVMRLFDVDYPEAKRIQKSLFHKHGTTLRGLMVDHGHAPEGFLDYVHEIDYAPVTENPELSLALENLPGRKLVFTAGTVPHAERVLARLGVTHHFEAIYDIVAAAYVPKPQRDPYDRFIAEHNVEPKRAAFFEDIARNLEVPHTMGMATVLVVDDENDDALQLNGKGPLDYVHHRTNNLAGFLHSLSPPEQGGAGVGGGS